jgi:hypothetical protein
LIVEYSETNTLFAGSGVVKDPEGAIKRAKAAKIIEELTVSRHGANHFHP